MEAGKRTVREWLHEYLLTALVCSNVVLGVLVVTALRQQNDLQEKWNAHVKVIADAQTPRSLTTTGVSVDEHPASVTIQQRRDEPPAGMVADLRDVLRALKE